MQINSYKSHQNTKTQPKFGMAPNHQLVTMFNTVNRETSPSHIMEYSLDSFNRDQVAEVRNHVVDVRQQAEQAALDPLHQNEGYDFPVDPALTSSEPYNYMQPPPRPDSRASRHTTASMNAEMVAEYDKNPNATEQQLRDAVNNTRGFKTWVTDNQVAKFFSKILTQTDTASTAQIPPSSQDLTKSSTTKKLKRTKEELKDVPRIATGKHKGRLKTSAMPGYNSEEHKAKEHRRNQKKAAIRGWAWRTKLKNPQKGKLKGGSGWDSDTYDNG